ncbi:hypothetical protein [Nocardia australiensis]|nr:hypothetical protein [Nocardia australiensis]
MSANLARLEIDLMLNAIADPTGEHQRGVRSGTVAFRSINGFKNWQVRYE